MNMKKLKRNGILFVGILLLLFLISTPNEANGLTSLQLDNMELLLEEIDGEIVYSGYTDWYYCDTPFFCQIKRTVEAPDNCVDKRLIMWSGWALCTYNGAE